MAMDEAMQIGLGRLKLSPKDFWAMTPREFSAALRGAFPASEAGLSRGELEKLMTQFPDGDASKIERGTNHGG